MGEGKAALQVSGLRHAFRRTTALRSVTFEVARQSIHGFVGPNGAGKTTTLKIASTLLRPQQGRALVFDCDVVTDYRTVRRRIGFMPDHFSMYRQMTVFEYLDFFAAAYGLRLKARNQVIGDVLELTDMAGRRNDFISGLSRGMQQRVSLARVLVHDPDLLLLDEPASGLDPRARIELMEILRELRRMGKTIFISSHILSELAELCDSVTILDRGEVKYSGTMEGLLVHDHQQRTYNLKLAEAQPAVAEALRTLDGVSEVRAMEAEGQYEIWFDPETVSVNAILRAVMAENGEVVSFTQSTKQLNQAFMDLTSAGVPT